MSYPERTCSFCRQRVTKETYAGAIDNQDGLLRVAPRTILTFCASCRATTPSGIAFSLMNGAKKEERGMGR